MELSFQNIENETSESLMLQAEALLDFSAVRELKQLERHFWVAHVAEGDHSFEVELKTAPGRLKDATCECEEYREKGICAHILAAVMLIRKQAAATPKPERKARKAPVGKLTTSVILDEVPAEELLDFIKSYAQKNRNFELALKAHFASAVSRLDSAEKYMDLLEANMAMGRKSDRNFTPRGAQNLLKLVKELLQQAKDTLLQRDYNETWLILQSILLKLPPVLNKSGDGKEDLFEELLETLKLIHKLAEQPTAPELKNSLWDFFLEESSRLVYRNHGLDIAFFQVLGLLNDEEEKTLQVSRRILDQLQSYEEENREIHPLIFQYLSLTSSGLHHTLLRHSYGRVEEIIPAIELALLSRMPETAKILLEFSLTLSLSPLIKQSLQDLHLEIARQIKDKNLEVRLLIQKISNTYDIQDYHHIKALEKEGVAWDPAALIQTLKKDASTEEQYDCVATILAEEGRLEALLDWVTESKSVEVLLNHDHHLLPKYQEQLVNLYKNWLSDFLDAHIGPVPAKKIGRIINHFKSIQADELVHQLINYLKNHYPKRHTLMEELAIYDAYED
jgi:hypothetical protein